MSEITMQEDLSCGANIGGNLTLGTEIVVNNI